MTLIHELKSSQVLTQLNSYADCRAYTKKRPLQRNDR